MPTSIERRSAGIRRSLSKPIPKVRTTLSSSNRVDGSSQSPITIFLRNTEHARARAAPHCPRPLRAVRWVRENAPSQASSRSHYGLRNPLGFVPVLCRQPVFPSYRQTGQGHRSLPGIDEHPSAAHPRDRHSPRLVLTTQHVLLAQCSP